MIFYLELAYFTLLLLQIMFYVELFLLQIVVYLELFLIQLYILLSMYVLFLVAHSYGLPCYVLLQIAFEILYNLKLY